MTSSLPLPPPPPLPRSYYEENNIEECKEEVEEEEVMYYDEDEEESIYLEDDYDHDDDDLERGPAKISRHSSSHRSTQSSSSSRNGPVKVVGHSKKSASAAGAPVIVVKKKKKPRSSSTTTSTIQQQSSSSLSTTNNSKNSSVLKAPSRKVPKNKKQKKNKDFEEFEATGKWGEAPSNKEMYLVGGLAVTILLTIIIIVSVFVSKNKDSNGSDVPTAEVFPSLSPQEELDLIQSAIAANPVTNQYAGNFTIAITVEELQRASSRTTETTADAADDDGTDALVQAASWVVLQDNEINESNRVLQRFILASLYFETNGQEWKNNNGWLRPDLDVCGSDGWYGLRCDNNDMVTEIQLTGNNLQGRIPVTLALLNTLRALWLDSNKMTGDVKGEIFTLDMPDFQFLYLQTNQLTGTIPSNFLDNDSDLRTIFLQGNDFTGSFPDAYCPKCATCPHPLMQFGLDCQTNACPNQWCCNPTLHCFD